MKVAIFIVVGLVCLGLANGTVYEASDVVGARAALLKLESGDTLRLAAGEWRDLDLELSVSGEVGRPISIDGAAGGKTVLTGRTRIAIGGSYVRVSGLHFLGVEPLEGEEALVSFRVGSSGYARDSALVECWFDACNPVDASRRYAWVRLYGSGNSVEGNLFSGQAHSGVTVQVMMHEANAGHRILGNHFLERAPGDGNGFECIQIGQSQDSEKRGGCLIEGNLFERCDGETEVVSVKTCENRVIGNTFLRSKGTLTLRHGDRNVVEDNVFFGMGELGTGGIRVIGKGHLLKGNYLEGVGGLTGGAIVLYSGIPDSPLNGYFAADGARLENNVVVDCVGNGVYLNGGYGERGRTILPKGVALRGNVIQLRSGGGTAVVGALPGMKAEGNLIGNGTETGRYELEGFEKRALAFRRGIDGLLFPVGSGGARMLKRSEVGPSWKVATPRLGTLDEGQVGRLIRGDVAGLEVFVTAELERAERILGAGTLYSVTFNERVPPSGDMRSYYSTGPYWWRNPDTADGLPYVRRDGEFNPERDLVSDRESLHAMVGGVWSMAVAYAATGDERFVEWAGRLLEVWFLDEATRMLPNLRHAQAIPGVTDGRGTGVIDALVLVELTDALALLELSPAWGLAERRGLRDWLGSYLDWLSESANGLDERAAVNNHGTAYDLQQLALAHFLELDSLVERILRRVVEERIPRQVTAAGEQPLEFARTRSWSYCTENLEHFMRIAAIGRKRGVDVFGMETAAGAGVKKALGWVAGHACDPATSWPGKQMTAWQSEYIYAALAIASGLDPAGDWAERLACVPVPGDALKARLMRPSGE